MVLIDAGASVSAVFTRNRFCAAPVQVCREHLASGAAVRALVINTGNANAGTGADGLQRARSTCNAMAQRLGLQAQEVWPFSTGVIMEPLPADRIEAGLDAAIAAAREDNWFEAALGIMTTDTVPKAFSAKALVGGAWITVTGISKGAGMIRPNMATMLGFLATDACVDQAVMQQLSRELADGSFNCVTVDGDTSTNDSLVVIASNKAAHAPVVRWTVPTARRSRRPCWVSPAAWPMPSCATAKAPPSSSRSASTVARRSRSAARLPAPLPIHPWSRRHFLPATRTWGASWLRSVMPASTIWIRS